MISNLLLGITEHPIKGTAPPSVDQKTIFETFSTSSFDRRVVEISRAYAITIWESGQQKGSGLKSSTRLTNQSYNHCIIMELEQ